MTKSEITVREVETIEEMRGCIELQRAVFAAPDMEISPVRHLIVARYAGGFTLGAFLGERLVGFVLSLPMYLKNSDERAFYSHMTAVDTSLQSLGIGAKLKWAQRRRALSEGANYIKWTYQPVLARNAFFNLERLGVTIKTYMPNFYGTDAEASAEQKSAQEGVDSDRLFADWHLLSPKTVALSRGEKFEETGEAVKTIEIPPDWNSLVVSDTKKAILEQARIKHEFQTAFAEGLIARGFERSERNPKYLLYKK
jgi:predicted GNAT superfamily acetyltransferase